MKRIKTKIVGIAFSIMLLGVCGFFISGLRLNKLNNEVEQELKAQKVKLASEQEQLEQLKKELAQMDTIEYIEKVATEQLGMVESDTIVFREKQ